MNLPGIAPTSYYVAGLWVAIRLLHGSMPQLIHNSPTTSLNEQLSTEHEGPIESIGTTFPVSTSGVINAGAEFYLS